MMRAEKNIEDFPAEVRVLRREVDELRGEIARMRHALALAAGIALCNPAPDIDMSTTTSWPHVTTTPRPSFLP